MQSVTRAVPQYLSSTLRAAVVTCLAFSLSALAHPLLSAPPESQPAVTPLRGNLIDDLPDAPQAATTPNPPAAEHAVTTRGAFPNPGEPLTLHERFVLESHTTFGPSAFLVPLAQAAIIMADPPSHYPHEWSDGGGALGRNYGAELARHTTGGLTHFAVAALVREDPRYYPCERTNVAARAVHAIAFTIVDRSDSGRRTLAVSNLAGSAAAGFIGMTFYPDGFNDVTHGYQRSAIEISSFASHNLIAEFSPEISHVLHKLHFPDRIANAFLPEDRRQP